ncbi:MAG: hypothetical protein HZB13_14205 [Acidobacteria bacterium]|nr:hypothetical protein [Acidobacteriota bacterium]
MKSGKTSTTIRPAATSDIVAQVLVVAQFLTFVPIPAPAGISLSPAGAKTARPRALRSAA